MKKATRDDEVLRPWPVGTLGLSPAKTGDNSASDPLFTSLWTSMKSTASGGHQENADRPTFYPWADFSVFKGTGDKSTPKLSFHHTMLVSQNYYRRQWSLSGNHRLKNICVIMEWVPDKEHLKTNEPPTLPTTRQKDAEVKAARQAEEVKIKQLIEMYDNDGNGTLEFGEARPLFKDLGVTLTVDEVENALEDLDHDGDGTIGTDELRDAIVNRNYYQIKHGRYFVVLTLREAEGVRAAMHHGAFGGGTMVALRYGLAGSTTGGSRILETTSQFEPASHFHSELCDSTFRFCDSELEFEDESMSMLLWQLQSDPLANRSQFFNDIRACRRRSMKEWEGTSLRLLFTEETSLDVMETKAIISRIKTQIYMHYGKR